MAKKQAKGTKKIYEHTPSKATQVSAFETNGKQFIGIRTMYKKKGDEKWSPGRGVSIEVGEDGEKILKRALKMMRDEETVYEELTFDK